MVKLLANKWGNSLNLIKDICMHANSLLSCLTLCNPMAVARQAPLPMGFSRQEYEFVLNLRLGIICCFHFGIIEDME